MKKNLLHLFLLLIAVTVSPTLWADTYTENGIKYNFYRSTGHAEVGENQNFVGDAIIAESLKILGREYPVTGISNYAFSGCTELTSVSLPKSLKEINLNAFRGCTGLTSVTLPHSLQKIGSGAFYGCTGLTSLIMLSQSLAEIHDLAFGECRALKEIIVEEENLNFTSHDGVLFNKNSSHIVLYPPGKEGSYTIPETVTSIGESAFQSVRLISITLPKSIMSVETNAFYEASCENLIVKATLDNESQSNLVNGLSGSIVTNIHNVNWSYGGKPVLSNRYTDFKGAVHLYDLSFEFQDYNSHLKGFTFQIVPNPYWDSTETTEATLSAGDGWSLPTPNADGVYLVKDLDIDTGYELCLNWSSKAVPSKKYSTRLQFFTTKPVFSWDSYTSQSSVIVKYMSSWGDSTCKFDGRMGVRYTHWNQTTEENVVDEIEYNGEEFTLTNLPPDSRVEIFPYAYFDGERFDFGAIRVKTKPLNPMIKVRATGPTSAELEGSYTEGDAVISWMGIEGDECTAKTLIGLAPDMQYSATFVIKSCGQTYSSEPLNFTTDPLNLTVVTPRCVSSTCAIVAAETNITEAETNAGFQWKKYDAPESLKPTEGYAAIYDGMLEGYIKNLQPTSFYNVRPFYKDSADNYYYGEWVTFDPSDFSYFGPTVHTYPAEDVCGTSATMRGYVLRGTDDITAQGFEYWELVGQNTERKQIPTTGVMSVEGFGQVMRVVVEGLKTGTRYSFRTYVQTVSGMTYGEEQVFSTTGTAAVDEITDDVAPQPLGYFDLYGHRYDEPRTGLNIVVYSDGSSRKFICR